MGNGLNAFIEVAPFMNQLHGRDMAVAITDREKYVAFVPGKELNFPVKAGDPVKESTVVYQAMESGKRIAKVMGKEVFGFPYMAIAIPVYENGKIVGGVCFLESIQQQSLLLDMAETLYKGISQVQASTQQIASESEELMEAGEGLIISVDKMKADTNASQEITRMIKKISDQTNMLGLNASIEAARLGEIGRGFDVVAGEIRKLASSTKESIGGIDSIVMGLDENSKNMEARAKGIEVAARSQVNSIEEIRKGIEELYQLIEKIREEANNLCK